MDLDIDGVEMSKKSLFVKSMLLVMIPVILVSLLIILVSQQSIKEYFEEESFKTLNNEIERFQEINSSILNYYKYTDKISLLELNRKLNAPLPYSKVARPNKSARGTIVIETNNGDLKVLGEANLLINLENDLIKENKNWPFQGQTNIEDENIFYSISLIEKGVINDLVDVKGYRNLYYLAYISETYSSDLTKEIMSKIFIGISFLVFIITAVLFFVFRKISLRLRVLEKEANKIGKGDFDVEISLNPEDEIGRLGKAMSLMGKKLGIAQKGQAENFQMISHELKTPIMIMQGYIEAMANEQYPNGTREETINIIQSELKKLENLTKDLIALNKADYMSKNNLTITDINLSELFKEVVLRLKGDSLIHISIEGEHTLIGDRQTWTMLIENIISNQLRYAKNNININLSSVISVKNDGDNIEEVLIEKIRKPFTKGEAGRSGLGLTIIDNILSIYDYKLEIINLDLGIEYLIKKNNYE